MADSYNLVDSTLQDMRQNNPADVLNYQPGPMMGGGQDEMGMGMEYAHSPVQHHRDVRMGEVNYLPPQQQQAPTMQTGMAQNMAGEPMIPMEEDADAVMEAPDLTEYGMNEGGNGMMDNVLNELKLPLVVAVLAFLLALPQVNGMFRSMLSRFTTNPMYVNAVMALALGLAVWAVGKFLA